MSDKVVIFDTTLRDGEQSPGCSMTLDEKVILARQIEKLGVDIIEAGFPAASDGDFNSVRTVAQEIPPVSGSVHSVILSNGSNECPTFNGVQVYTNLGLHRFIRDIDGGTSKFTLCQQ